MSHLRLPVRYYRMGPAGDEEYVEGNFDFVNTELAMPTEQMALVLVDCWDIWPNKSFAERAEQISEGVLVPVAEACRKAGISVIHAPSPAQARLYQQWTRYASEAELFGPQGPPPAWPPEEMRNREGDYAQFAKDVVPQLKKWREEELDKRKIIVCLEPHPEDFVIATGEQLHRLCRHQGVMHLVYAGFAANLCVPGRDYGTRAFNARGYNIILLRDGTSAVEAHTTLDGMSLTEAAVLDTEMAIGFTATSGDFLSACATAGPAEPA